MECQNPMCNYNSDTNSIPPIVGQGLVDDKLEFIYICPQCEFYMDNEINNKLIK